MAGFVISAELEFVELLLGLNVVCSYDDLYFSLGLFVNGILELVLLWIMLFISYCLQRKCFLIVTSPRNGGKNSL